MSRAGREKRCAKLLGGVPQGLLVHFVKQASKKQKVLLGSRTSPPSTATGRAAEAELNGSER